MVPRCTSCWRNVGRMPIMTMRLPVSRALVSAALRLPLIVCSRSAIASPSSCCGGTLISRLNCPTSVAQAGSAMAASTSALRIDGAPSASTRFSSISWPPRPCPASNESSCSIRANTSSERRTLSRYVRLSAPLNVIGAISRPILPRSARGENFHPLSSSVHTRMSPGPYATVVIPARRRLPLRYGAGCRSGTARAGHRNVVPLQRLVRQARTVWQRRGQLLRGESAVAIDVEVGIGEGEDRGGGRGSLDAAQVHGGALQGGVRGERGDLRRLQVTHVKKD